MKLKLCAAVLLAALIHAPQASALPVSETYFGVVDATQLLGDITVPAPDYDSADLFGGGNLEGDFITATFTYDTSLGLETNTGLSDEVDGGSEYLLPSPITSATFTIQAPLSGTTYSYSYAPDLLSDVFTGADDPNTGADDLHDFAYSTNLDQSFVYLVPTTAVPASVAFSYSGVGLGAGSYFEPGATKTGVLDDIVFDTLQVTVSAAPEPGSWALMIAGLALMGALMRLQRRSESVALSRVTGSAKPAS